MKWFGRKSAGGAARPALVQGGSWTGSGAWPQSYDTQVRDAYCHNPVAHRAVKLVSEGLASAPLTGSDPALVALVQARSGGQALPVTLAAQLLLHGNAYVQLLCDSAGTLTELYALRPERVSVEPDASGWPVAYRYRVGAHSMRLAAEDPAGKPAVVHLKAFHPSDDHYGLGCLGAAAGAVAIHNAAARWNKALLDNAARPSGALVYEAGDGAVLTPEQFDRLRGEMEAGFAGAANAGRPMLLEGGLRWQAMSLSPADMDFVGLKAAAAREIALAFGVPPMLMGLPGDNAYANYREANRALWRQTILPLADHILAGLAQGLQGWFPGAALAVDLNKVAALAEDRERLWVQLGGADFLSRDEKRAMLGVEAEIGAIERGAGATPGNMAGEGRRMMGEAGVLAQLIEQAQGDGAALATLRAIAEEAGELGARRALARLGLEDAGAAKDMGELRELLAAWRDAKRSALKAAFAWAGRMATALLLIGLAVKLGFPGWLK